MRKALYTSMILLSAAFARENPFFSMTESVNLPVSSNSIEHKPRITSMTYNFPDQARVLKEATFTFQNLDGSLETRRLEIDQSIDWRTPLVLSQSGSGKSDITANNRKSSHASNGFIQFMSSGKRISIVSKDPMIRYFTLSDPDSVVVDFKHVGVFEPFEQPLSASPYVKVKVTNHGKFARAIIMLDGHYSCKASKTEQGASIICQ